MDRKLINPLIVTGIADAVRAKGKTTEPIKVADLPNAIMNLPEGGGVGEDTSALLDAIGVESREDTGMANGLAIALTDTPTEQMWSGERTTADGEPIKDGVAFVSTLKGKTLKVNQLADITKWGGFHGTLSINDDELTLTVTTADNYVMARVTVKEYVDGHKYLFLAKVKTPQNNTIDFGDGVSSFGAKSSVANNYVTVSHITISRAGRNTFIVYVNRDSVMSVGDKTYLKDMMLKDLTEEYGSGNEPTTPEQYANDHGYARIEDMPYIPYQDTNLQSFAPNAIVSKGRNLFNKDAEQISINSTDENRAKGIALNLSPGTYYAKAFGVAEGFYYLSSIDKATNKIKASLIRYFTTPTASKKGVFTIAEGEDAVIWNASSGTTMDRAYLTAKQIMICRGNVEPTDYTPYIAPSRLDIDLTTIVDSQGNQLFPDGELRSAGSVCDMVDYANNVVVRGKKVIGRVDMGELTWIKQTVTEGAPIDRYACTALTTKARGFLNLVCAKFAVDQKIFDAPQTANPNCICGRSNNQYIYVSTEIGAYANGASFKSAMQGVYLDFELAEPIEGEAPITKAWYPVQSNGSEEAITDTIVPMNAEIRYRIDTESLLTQSASLLRYSNEVTGADNTSLGDAVKTLTDNYK